MRLVAVIFLALVGVSLAETRVEIRAQSELTLSHVRLRDNGVIEVYGRLVDKLTGEGLADQRVYVLIAGKQLSASTGLDGTFKVEAPGEPGTQAVELHYGGTGGVDAAPPLEVTTDPAKAQIELSLTKVSDDRLQVRATSDDGPVAVQVTLDVETSDGRWKTIGAMTTGPISYFVLSRKAIGAGQHRLRATFAGDDVRQRATAETTVEIAASTTTTMEVASTQLKFEDDLVVTGQVVDDDKQPVARAAVALTSGDKRLAQGATDSAGKYQFKVEAQLLGDCAHRPCPFGIQVQADPPSSYMRASRSDPAVVNVAAPQPVPVSYTIAAFLATALAAGGFFAARTKPWLRFRRPQKPAEVPSQEGKIEIAHGGLVVAKPGVMSTLRRASDDGFSGVVRDTARGRPVGQAVVRLLLGPEVEAGGLRPTAEVDEREVRTSSEGTFVIEQLHPGEYRAEVAAPGHVTERFSVTIPHRGELRGVRIDLVPVRERVFQLYRRAAEPILPEARLWGIWSPRQIVDHVRGKRPSPALAELTDFIEEIYFSPRLAAETVLPQASERVDRAITERARRGI